ncbi:MAG: 2-oxoacid:acceptor oxidoreductase family protein [Planctomycetota bacterium]|nr:2-oxoacid:acceptor oxidoreductase family protein [Planctomycetota bacterium]
MLRVRFHGRGGQGAKVASRILGTAAFIEGYYAQDFPLYGAERRGAPIVAFTRISKEPILERGVIAEPDIVIVIDETLLNDSQAHPLLGLKKSGIAFINTTHSPVEAKARYEVAAQVATLDITKVGLEMLGRPVLSALAGGVASRIAGLKDDSLRKAVEKEVSDLITEKELLIKNIEASLYCFNVVQPIKVIITEITHKGSPVFAVPFEGAAVSSPAINVTGNTPLRKTGNWRVFKPVWRYDICTKCMTCVARCPDGCIAVSEEGFPYSDYDNCKGCMICAEECPVKAIEKVWEVHAW